MDAAAQVKRRATDQGPLCWLALRAGQFWDFIDRRDIDKHAVSLAFLFGTVKATSWAMAFSETSTRPGLEVAAIIAAVLAPFMTVQGVVIKWYFDART